MIVNRTGITAIKTRTLKCSNTIFITVFIRFRNRIKPSFWRQRRQRFIIVINFQI
ncbi:hypothetical protein HanPI659440_Chr12g0469091 [Helianthus annuus]|nr:hypothetical protein HanHA300_Chr12g0452061 [Helianthus annuus]KAJ0494250.1 hypothetical protein HanIR_Chr12g0595321 [Helianthus annuus]KAJ0506053.1 hypothetical protein HanHA89_Chr12g0477571 [Helianthus annuus]KAJ0675723.1 hypothetical protein HanLR1_Chr12g0454461 [Helianthus annuus]KAJ0726332.1 hypothetical protein HanPI659440_Chr12g0469091 [Helianthus annuus]